MANLYEDPIFKIRAALDAQFGDTLLHGKWPVTGLSLEMADRLANRQGYKGALDRKMPVTYEPILSGFRPRKPVSASKLPAGLDALLAEIEALNALWDYRAPRWDSYGVTR